MKSKENLTSLQLGGIHHLTAVTAAVKKNRKYYTDTLGLRLVKKTVNQDDTSAYHLFYADGKGTPGTDITFFDWPAAPERRGTRSIARTSFRVSSGEVLRFWEERLDRIGARGAIRTIDGHESLDFEDEEGQRLRLIVDTPSDEFAAWAKSSVPSDKQIQGLGPIILSVPDLHDTARVLTDVLNMRVKSSYTDRSTDGGAKDVIFHVFEMGKGGLSSQVHVAVEPHLSKAFHGAGGVHHVAFRVNSYAAYEEWAQRLQEFRLASSGPIDRFYFRSLYFREPNGILFELATDGPGFAADESPETMGEKLALPPFLEGRRAQIEARLKEI